MPATKLNAILTGALINSSISSFLIIHFLSIAGVAGTYTWSRLYLGEIICKSTFLKPHLQFLNDQVEMLGRKDAILTMISLRLMPGSPNLAYNLILPHISSLTMNDVIFSVALE